MKKNPSILFYITLPILICSLPVFGQETFTLTTYYPAPFGVYQEIRSQRAAIGPTYFDPSVYSWGNQINQDAVLVVDGKVGIGTTTPNYKLDLLNTTPGNVNFLLQLDRTDKDDYEAVMEFATNDQMQWWFGLDNDGTNKLHVGNIGTVHRQTWDKNGNVGIGTTSPSDGTASGGEQLKLDIEGAVGATYYCDTNGTNCVAPPLGGPAVGSYTGDGTTGRLITTGFKPRAVLNTMQNDLQITKSDSMNDYLAFQQGAGNTGEGKAHFEDSTKLVNTGFKVKGWANKSGKTYHYVAWP